MYNATNEQTLLLKAAEIRSKFERIETQLNAGPYFAGERFTMVDAVFGPVFRYFDVFEQLDDFAFFNGTPRVRTWSVALAARPSVKRAVSPDYAMLLLAFLAARKSALSRRIEQPVTG